MNIEVDDSDLQRALHQLAAGIAGTDRVGMAEASRTAAQIRAAVPKRTGRLASTVHPTRVDGGGAVSYGGQLPYAAYIEKRSRAVANAVRPAEPRYERAMRDAAEAEVRRI